MIMRDYWTVARSGVSLIVGLGYMLILVFLLTLAGIRR